MYNVQRTWKDRMIVTFAVVVGCLLSVISLQERDSKYVLGIKRNNQILAAVVGCLCALL